MSDKENIKRQCDANLIDPSLAPKFNKDGSLKTTYCNFAVWKVAHAVGYTGFDCPDGPIMANQMVAVMRKGDPWYRVDASVAQAAARTGGLVVAGHEYKDHGHVAVVSPEGGLVYSGKWKMDVPTVCNIGKKQENCGANFAFDTNDTPPTYFALRYGMA